MKRLMPVLMSLSVMVFVSSSLAQNACRSIFENAKRSRLSAYLEFQPTTERGLEDLALMRYKPRRGSEALEQLQRIGPQFKVLIIDPGLVLRLTQFEDFVSRNNLRQADPWSAREAFSEHLGTHKVFRTLLLTTNEYRAILKNGIESNLLRFHPSARGLVGSALSTNMGYQIMERLQPGRARKPRLDPLLSVSDHVTIAAAGSLAGTSNIASEALMSAGPVAAFQEAFQQSLKQTYVFTIEVPEIDIVYRGTGLFDSENQPPISLRVSTVLGSRVYDFHSREVESFIVLKIDPDEIVSSRLILPTERSTFQFGEELKSPNSL